MQRRDAFNKLFVIGFDYSIYTKRSDRQKARMELSYKTVEDEISKLPKEMVNHLNKKIKILLIAENWCGDCANAVPVIASLAKKMDQWELKIVGKDDIVDEKILDYYTTAGRVKIPVIIFADTDGDEVVRWTERPTRSYKLLFELQQQRLPKEEYMAKYKSMPELKTASVAREILLEIINKVDHTASLLQILPKKK